MNLCSK